ncbi:uncharacterized protein LOC131606177 [Vicia villosa]|uniref:uncharacterized protein LOC131606177 n=1 Tax=Vicia villosa TaxID=3911 RepID=UPI00273C9450|nr:uncharacterized protein LOC131606177 [Vicia villosa]
MPTRRHITIPPWAQLHQDVLDVISQKLDFDDLFQFSRVCKDWRVFYKTIDKSKFLTSQEPLLVEFFQHPVKIPYSFTSLPTQKVYPLKKMMTNMLSYSNNNFPIYVTYSSGYFILIDDNSSFLLINPFTRIQKKVICTSAFFEFSPSYEHTYRALLAFDKSSEEDFVLLFLFIDCNSLHVYQSRNNGWVTYCDEEDDDAVVDFVALNNIIYVVTEEAKIGVLCLDKPKIEYLPMVNSPDIDANLSFFNLVKCGQQLLLVRLNPSLSPAITRGAPPPERKAYKIDFSTMTYVELETLGDIALFYVSCRTCKALINPNKWGYESNSVYEVYNSIRINNPFVTVYNWDKKSEKYIEPPNPRTKGSFYDWCFRHPDI